MRAAELVHRTRYCLRHAGEDVAVPEGGLVVGRSSDCGLQLSGGLVSRRHARVEQTSEGLVVEDLGSRNGVLVNDRRISGPALLSHGDVVGIGLERFEVVDQQLLRRPEHLSTLPPASPPFEHADADDTDNVTVAASLDVLTEREREVLELIVLGHTQREMAERLHVSVKTIETHRARIGEKLRCSTRAELVAYAVSAGLLGRRRGS